LQVYFRLYAEDHSGLNFTLITLRQKRGLMIRSTKTVTSPVQQVFTIVLCPDVTRLAVYHW